MAALTLATSPVVPAQAPAAARLRSLTLLSRDWRRPLNVARIDGRPMVALADLAAIFHLSVRADALAGGVTVTFENRVSVLTAAENLISVGGRVVTLPVPPVQRGQRWFVPVAFINRALPLLLGTRLQVRRASGLVIVGDLRVPEVDVTYARTGTQARVTFAMTPPTPHTIEQEPGRLLVKLDADALEARLPGPVSGSLVSSIHATGRPTWIAIDLGPDF